MPVLTRMPKQRVKTQVVCLAPGAVPAAVLRQSGVPVHDVALSRQRFSFGGFGELLKAAKAFKPDVIQAWGYTAQIVANQVRKRYDLALDLLNDPNYPFEKLVTGTCGFEDVENALVQRQTFQGLKTMFVPRPA